MSAVRFAFDNDEANAILAAIKNGCFTSGDIAHETSILPDRVRLYLRKLIASGRVEKRWSRVLAGERTPRPVYTLKDEVDPASFHLARGVSSWVRLEEALGELFK